MCGGVTQGRPGAELSLFSREVIAMATAIALSHDMFDAAVFLGVCDKIVPGLVIGALTFGHLPAVFVPAGPMPSGMRAMTKNQKSASATPRARRPAPSCWRAESAAYHAPGTCTFYGTANSNQMLMEVMGLHLPGASVRQSGYAAARCLTRAAATRALAIGALGNDYTPIGACARRACLRQRHRGAARHRRLDQSRDASHRDGEGRRHRPSRWMITPHSRRSCRR